MEGDKFIFLTRNLLRGFLWLFLLVGAFFLFKRYVDLDYLDWLKPVYDKPVLVYAIYSISELFFGVIPPEIFMMWGLRTTQLTDYVITVLLLACISYIAGLIGYGIGKYLEHTWFFKWLKNKIFGKYEAYLFQYGAFIILVAALTPLPFSGVSMLVGSVDFPLRKYLYFSLARFARFFAYSYIIWQVNMF